MTIFSHVANLPRPLDASRKPSVRSSTLEIYVRSGRRCLLNDTVLLRLEFAPRIRAVSGNQSSKNVCERIFTSSRPQGCQISSTQLSGQRRVRQRENTLGTGGISSHYGRNIDGRRETMEKSQTNLSLAMGVNCISSDLATVHTVVESGWMSGRTCSMARRLCKTYKYTLQRSVSRVRRGGAPPSSSDQHCNGQSEPSAHRRDSHFQGSRPPAQETHRPIRGPHVTVLPLSPTASAAPGHHEALATQGISATVCIY